MGRFAQGLTNLEDAVETSGIHNCPVQGIQPLAEPASIRQFLEHLHYIVGDAFAGSWFGVAMVARPDLITTQLVALPARPR